MPIEPGTFCMQTLYHFATIISLSLLHRNKVSLYYTVEIFQHLLLEILYPKPQGIETEMLYMQHIQSEASLLMNRPSAKPCCWLWSDWQKTAKAEGKTGPSAPCLVLDIAVAQW
uniref:Uncharacterized protein n=1 Tax=Sphaerodactylus townsendi TaxID=933632 RepID=A0ACB8EYP6_9SAUR